MNLALTTDLDTDRFVSMCHDLQTLAPDKSFGQVLKVTLAQVLKFCIKHTKAASRSNIIASFGRRGDRFTFPGGEIISKSKRSGHGGDVEFFDISTFKPSKNKQAPVTLIGGKAWHDMTRFHWSEERWAKFQAFLAQTATMKPNASKKAGDMKAALDSRGLAKHSWYQVAEAIDMAAAVDAPQWVRDAHPQNGRTYENGRARMALEGAAAFIEVFNDYPAAIRMNGQQLINYGIISRAKAFEREVELGVFRDFKTRAERYPGLFVSSAS